MLPIDAERIAKGFKVHPFKLLRRDEIRKRAAAVESEGGGSRTWRRWRERGKEDSTLP